MQGEGDIDSRLKQIEAVTLEGYSGASFGDKSNFTVGVSFLTFGVIGIVVGIAKGKPTMKLPKRVIMHHYFNSIVKYSLEYAAAAGSSAFLYCVNGQILSNLFEDEVSELTVMQKNVLNGFLTGMLYKSTRGLIPMAVGGATGAILIAGMTLSVEYLRARDLIAFEMKF